jgi:RND family efflux transporter MFP subunit
MKKRTRNIAILAIVVLAILAAAVLRIVTRRSGSSGRRQPITVVRTEQPSRETVAERLAYSGDIVSQQQANVVAKVSGTLEQVEVNMGSQVEQDQLLARIDETELTQQSQQASATWLAAQAAFKRKKQLLDSSLISPQDFESAEATMKTAEANYQTAQTRLSYARITAPFTGTVTKRYFDAGAIVTANSSTLFTLMDLDNLKVVINVLEKDVLRMSIGAGASVTADALPEDSLNGRIARLSEAVDPATRTMPVEVFVTDRSHRLKPGMYATVSLLVDEHPDAVTVPEQAALSDAAGSYVYIVESDTARRRTVQTGIRQDSRIEILSGLSGAESVVTAGQQAVRDNSPVIVQSIPQPGARQPDAGESTRR